MPSYAHAAQLSMRDHVHVPQDARVVPSELRRAGWRSLGTRPYTPFRACAGKAFNLSLALCRKECTSADNSTSRCRVCDPLCGAEIQGWESPTGQKLESLTTATDPPFVFAYNPFDEDMRNMRRNLIVEPTLTRVWHELTWECCSAPNGVVVDVGGNYGWYTLFSLALGCSVVVFEPVPRYVEVMQLGLSLNPGFGSRVTIFSNVVYDTPGVYSLRVPDVNPKLRRPIPLGMTGMNGRAGVIKTVWSSTATTVEAKAVRLDDVIQRDVCLLKADVEGYEPQVFQTAAALLSRYAVPVLQLEMTHTKDADQTCASINMLEHLHGPLKFEMRQLRGAGLHRPLPFARSTPWKMAPSAWHKLPTFPSRPGKNATWAYRNDFLGYSTNLVAVRKRRFRPGAPRPWPPMVCLNGTRARPEPKPQDLSSKHSLGCEWVPKRNGGAECISADAKQDRMNRLLALSLAQSANRSARGARTARGARANGAGRLKLQRKLQRPV